jgi:hypothetical protein
VDEGDKHDAEALARYRAALALFPSAQAPLIALSRLQDGMGDAAAASESLEHSFAATTARRVDPWWWYFAPLIDIDALALSLRTQVRE